MTWGMKMRKICTAIPLLLVLTGCAQLKSPEKPAAPAATTPPPVASSRTAVGEGPTGVGYVGPGLEPEDSRVIVKAVNPFRPITVRVVGSGAPPNSSALTASQRKLLSIRAARLDAFRALAEQVQGMKLVGNSSVANMVSVSDSFRTYVDAYLRGVNIVSATVAPDGSSEVIAEIVLDKDFYQQFRQALHHTGSVMKASQQEGAIGTICPENGCGSSSRYNSNFYNVQ